MDLISAYETLGVPVGADTVVVRAAYRRLVAYYHPDRNSAPEALHRTQLLNQAYGVVERAGFPSLTSVQGRARSAYGYRPEPSPSWGGDADPWADYYRDFDEPNRAYGRPGRTISRKVKLTIEEAAVGKVIEIAGSVTDNCTTCNGGKYSSVTTCSRCRGSGHAAPSRRRQTTYWYDDRCEACRGTGEARVDCRACGGTGHGAKREYANRVRVPAGVMDGDRVVIRSAGGRSVEGDGDIKIRVEIQPHELFTFDHDGYLCVTVPVHPLQVVAGVDVPVPTLWGTRGVVVTDPSKIDEVPEAGFVGRHGERFPLRVKWQLVFDTGTRSRARAESLWKDIEHDVLTGAKPFSEFMSKVRNQATRAKAGAGTSKNG